MTNATVTIRFDEERAANGTRVEEAGDSQFVLYASENATTADAWIALSRIPVTGGPTHRVTSIRHLGRALPHDSQTLAQFGVKTEDVLQVYIRPTCEIM